MAYRIDTTKERRGTLRDPYGLHRQGAMGTYRPKPQAVYRRSETFLEAIVDLAYLVLIAGGIFAVAGALVLSMTKGG